MEEKLRGRKLLKVAGAICIAFGALMALACLLAPAAMRLLSSMAERTGRSVSELFENSGSLRFRFAVLAVGAAVHLSAGIAGVKCSGGKRAGICLAFAGLLLAYLVFTQAAAIAAGTFGAFRLLLSLILPGLYLAGALLNWAGGRKKPGGA